MCPPDSRFAYEKYPHVLKEIPWLAQTTVPFVAMHDHLADFFTKHLAPKHFFAMRDVIMNIP